MSRPWITLLFMVGCPGRGEDGPGGSSGGDLDLQLRTVVFDEGQADSGAGGGPLLLALADGDEACSLLAAVWSVGWVRCESGCQGLFDNQDAWPAGELRLLWLELFPDGQVEGHYDAGTTDAPGTFAGRYLQLDLGRLGDQDGCFDSCLEDPSFLFTADSRSYSGDLEVESYAADLLQGSYDLIVTEGDSEGSFSAEPCALGY